MTPDGTRLGRALEWIARLPLSGERELAALLGVDGNDARGLTYELAKRGWVESIEPGSPELELRRRSFVREQALPALAAALSLTSTEITRALPVRLKDTLDRVVRVEITAGVNRLLADLAWDLRRSGIAELADARSLPLAVPARDRWWLPGIDGYGCLRAGNLWAPFLVAWDRAGAPDLHRRRRVAAWSAASAAVATQWGTGGLPAILLVCPSSRELRVWEQALSSRADDGTADRLDVLLTTREELQAHGPCGPVWRAPRTDQAVLLVERLGWGGVPPVPPVCLPEVIDGIAEQPSRTAPSIREWASAHAAATAHGPVWQRIAVLAVATGADEKRLIEWVARHPLVSAGELGTLLNESEALIERRLDWLARCGAVCAQSTTSTGESIDEGNHPLHQDLNHRYVLTELGMRSLAVRAGVPLDSFARHGGVTFVDPTAPDDPARVIRHREHTIGVNRFFAQLAADARHAGWHLHDWRNEAESTRRFLDEDGRPSWIRPDGSGVLRRGATSRSFLLEYDRGTLDVGDYRAKFDGYRRYFAQRKWEGDFPNEPVLLFVCSDDRAEERVLRAAKSDPPQFPMLLTSEWRYMTRGASRAGILGAVWSEGVHQGGRGPLSPEERGSADQETSVRG